MRAFLNILAIVAMFAAAYGVGKLNHSQRFTEKPQSMKWVDDSWYSDLDGNEYRDENGKIFRAEGCKNELGVITKPFMRAPKHKGDAEDVDDGKDVEVSP